MKIRVEPCLTNPPISVVENKRVGRDYGGLTRHCSRVGSNAVKPTKRPNGSLRQISRQATRCGNVVVSITITTRVRRIVS